MKNSNHTILAISLILILSGSFASNIKAQDSSDNAAKTDRADGFDTPQESLAAAIGLINPEKLQKYPDLTITNAFQGQAAGLTVVSGDGGFSNNSSTIYIRGQHGGATPAIIIVDISKDPSMTLLQKKSVQSKSSRTHRQRFFTVRGLPTESSSSRPKEASIIPGT